MVEPQFTHIDSMEDAARIVAQRLAAHLSAGKKVMWLVSGGSAIRVAADALKQLPTELQDKLMVKQIDERYGEVGHADSNWKQLQDAGFNPHHAMPVLEGKDKADTVSDFGENLAKGFQIADVTIGLLGMGADGHTAGILPHSSGVDSDDLAVGYEGPDFSRITTTGKALAHIDEAILVAMGEAKKLQLERLRDTIDPADQPAQLLKRCHSLTVLTDQSV